jgi:AhpD family alkylhydroperoxidase
MYSKDNLGKLNKIAKLLPKTMAAFRAWDKAALEEGAIPKKYKELIAIGVALTTQCPYCIDIHRQEALSAGAGEDELAEVIHVAAALCAPAPRSPTAHICSNAD